MSIFHMSIAAGILVVVIVIIRTIGLNRLPNGVFLVLWGIVVCRLLIPFELPSQYSIYGIIGDTSNAVQENNLPQQTTVPVLEQTAYIAPVTIVWFIGMLTSVIFFAAVFIKNSRELRFVLPVCDNEILSKWFLEYRMIRTIKVVQSERIATPVAVGIIKPRIILPKQMDMKDEQLLRYVLKHEYYHIKRLDALWKLILISAVCIHWFNPLVWIMFILASRDLEITCDGMVVRYFGIDKKADYAYSLISMAEKRSKIALIYNGFSKNSAEERIVSVMKIKKASIWRSVAALMLVICVIFVFATTKEKYTSNYYIDNLKNLSVDEKVIYFNSAMENNLENTLTNFEKVNAAYVHLFSDNDNNSANIVLSISDTLSDTEVDSIVNVVSKSIENIEKENINIKDKNENVIYPIG